MPPQFTLDWPYGWYTRDERDVVIYCTDAPGDWPIHGRIEGDDVAHSWATTGYSTFCGGHSLDDLINRPAPTATVPMDKLHDAVIDVLEGKIWYIPVPKNERLQIGALVKWFYADEVETSK